MNDGNNYFDELQEKLYSAVISDVLDFLGYRNQAMSSNIRPLTSEMVVVGRAKTVHAADVNRIPEQAYHKQIQVLDSIQPGEVFVATVSGSRRSAFFGELMSTATKVAGGRGAIVDGLTRDAKKIIKIGFPVFSIGYRPTDSLGRNEVMEFDVKIECGGVTVNPGDLIFGDMDGIVVVPQEIEEEVIRRALIKINGENLVRDKIMEGMKVSDAFEKYGVL